MPSIHCEDNFWQLVGLWPWWCVFVWDKNMPRHRNRMLEPHWLWCTTWWGGVSEYGARKWAPAVQQYFVCLYVHPQADFRHREFSPTCTVQAGNEPSICAVLLLQLHLPNVPLNGNIVLISTWTSSTHWSSQQSGTNRGMMQESR